ncbi:MAG TPA: acyl carrier protein [Chitinophaga sp.]|uniref:acyl carrier protein n=1 Tax=Chitinophaga sp. TaxID=1869181 RepID=UPI002CDC0BD5|nr:acyl carrier protein [Chitinophaga sp.]HVI44395.1 acyl carrier protein [Chitinophaga sp.]
MSTIEKVRSLVAQQLQVPTDAISTDATLEELGMTSILAVSLASRLEQEFGIELTDIPTQEPQTINSLTAQIEKLTSTAK